ncbi:MAG: LysR family transcriptional regulator [Nannocystaceae bacterium]
MLPDFNRLRVFFHVHRAGSVSAAAQALHVTQSAVSQSLAKLEEELGVQLFVRRHRAITPTPAAASLFSVVEPFVAALQGGVEAIHRARDELTGTLRLGAPAEFGARRLPEALARFVDEHPGVRFTLELGHPTALVPKVEDGQLDLAFVDVFDVRLPTAPRLAGLRAIEVMDEALVLFCAPAFERAQLAGGRGYARLAKLPFVDYHPTAPAVRGWFRHHFERVPARLCVPLAVESVQAVIAAVSAGMGLGVAPSHAIDRARAAGELTVITTRRRPLSNRITLVRAFERVPTRLEQTFVSYVTEALAGR